MGCRSIREAALAGRPFSFAPGYRVTRTAFPERGVLRPGPIPQWPETVAPASVRSIAGAAVAREPILAASPEGPQGCWVNPALEVALAIVALIALGVVGECGAFRSLPPWSSPLVPKTDTERDPLVPIRQIDATERKRRRGQHRWRSAEAASNAAQLRKGLAPLDARREELLQEQEKEYVGGP